MEPAPVMRHHLEFLASRLAWSRLLAGLALLVVGVTQPFAVVETEDGALVGTLSLGGVLGRSESLDNDTAASTFSVLLIVAVVVLLTQALSAVSRRGDGAWRITAGLALPVLALGFAAVAAIGAVEPVVATPEEESTALAIRLVVSTSAAGPIPLLLGAIAVWVAAARARRPERFLERPIPAV